MTKVVVPEPYIFFSTPASIAEEAAARPINSVFNNGPRSLSKNPPD